MQITLSDEDYALLAAVAKQRGAPIETLVHEAIVLLDTQPRGTYEYPTGEPDSPEDEAELEAIAQSIGDAHPWLSEMVIEDRGPR